MDLEATRWRMERARSFHEIWHTAAIAVIWAMVSIVLLSQAIMSGAVAWRVNVATGGSVIHVEEASDE